MNDITYEIDTYDVRPILLAIHAQLLNHKNRHVRYLLIYRKGRTYHELLTYARDLPLQLYTVKFKRDPAPAIWQPHPYARSVPT